ncbi:MAG: type II secretion system F family protein [Acidimicrobiia bacterium]|nr:type II secretion system F family protein [Acidimicrobiia bacterium]
MSTPAVVAAAAVGVAAAAAAARLVPPTPRLAPRVRPYTLAARSGFGGPAGTARGPATPVGTLRRLFGPPLLALARRLGRLVESRSDEALRTRLRHAGQPEVTPEEHRLRLLAAAVGLGALGLGAGLTLLHGAIGGLLLAACGSLAGAARARGRLDRAVAERRERMRAELYTVNQLLALHVRTGAGAVQAARRLVDRGRGAVVEELDEVLNWIRSGMGEAEAFRRAAERTAEPGAARTYRLLAAGAERGVDLAASLLSLSGDLRDARREDLRRSATRRRAAMLVPTIAVLAPIMLLFVAAPIPSLVFGFR